MAKKGRAHAILRDGPERMSEAMYHHLCNEDTGICRACGHQQGNCEPDARKYPCENCGAREVYGTEELLTREEIEIT